MRCTCSMALGAGCWGQGHAGLTPHFVHSSLTLSLPLNETWGWFPPSAPSLPGCGGSTHIWGSLTSGPGAGAATLSSLSVLVKYCVLHKLTERGDRVEGNESTLSTQLQNKYRTLRAGASSILIGISTRTPAPAEHFYRTENQFSKRA